MNEKKRPRSPEEEEKMCQCFPKKKKEEQQATVSQGGITVVDLSDSKRSKSELVEHATELKLTKEFLRETVRIHRRDVDEEYDRLQKLKIRDVDTLLDSYDTAEKAMADGFSRGTASKLMVFIKNQKPVAAPSAVAPSLDSVEFKVPSEIVTSRTRLNLLKPLLIVKFAKV